jgi:hypothetical protein
MPNISWDNLVEAAGEAGKAFEPLAADTYPFVVSEAEVGESKTGKKSIGITAIVESGPNAKRKVWNTWYISPDSPNALAYFFREMAIFGLTIDFWKSGPSDEQIVSNLVNKRFIGGLKITEYPEGSGKRKNEFDSFAAPQGSATGNAAATVGAGSGSTPSIPTTPQVASAVPQVQAAAPSVPQVPQAAAAPQVPSVPQASVPTENPWAAAAPPAPGL